jgi:hypothetical protein
MLSMISGQTRSADVVGESWFAPFRIVLQAKRGPAAQPLIDGP